MRPPICSPILRMPCSTSGSAMIELFRRLLRTRQGAIAIILLLIIVIACVAGPFVAPHDPDAISFLGRFHPPDAQYWLGADELGRDVFSRLLIGAGRTVPIALMATLLGTLSGAVIGTLSAYLGGRWD